MAPESKSTLVATLIALSLATACGKKGVWGSCYTPGDSYGFVKKCTDFSGDYSVYADQKSTCNASSGHTWSDSACDTTNECGHCAAGVAFDTNATIKTTATTYYFDQDGVQNSESSYETACLNGARNSSGASLNTWTDNPNVTCH